MVANTPAKYKYKAFDNKKNIVIAGFQQARNEMELDGFLRASKLDLIWCKRIEERASIFASKKVTKKDLISIFIHMEQLEKAGVNILDSLGDLRDFSDRQGIKDLASNLHESIKDGLVLSDAMEKNTNVFDNVTISLVRMGEKTGSLQLAFKNICDNIKWSESIKRKTMKAIKYPLFSLIVMLGVVALMLTLVVPKVTSFILEQDIPLPSYTTALIATSEFFQKNFFKMIVTGFGLYLAYKIAYRKPNLRLKIDFIKLKLPLVGKVMQKIDLSKFTKIFGVTFAAGIPILECITIAGNTVSNMAIKNDISRIRTDISNGQKLAVSVKNSIFFPNMVVRMFKIGEESGSMSNAMGNVEYFYENEINDGIDNLVGSLNPIMMFVMGGLMIWVIAAVFGPIYGSFDQMGQ
ncbi:MAG: type II secretion system F family protein [Rickettsiales bacterium]|jgi:type IV pilus assembly protein PilC|nr:type II secretion system F family protein [Rickettsiales bacterium]